jgi:hypothetical protein
MTFTASRTRPRRPIVRAVAVFAVLLGLFLMHGMSVGVDSARLGGSAPIAASLGERSGASALSASAGSGDTHAAPAVTQIEQCACDDAMSASCIPHRSQSSAALLAALLLALAWASTSGAGPRGGPLRATRSRLGAPTTFSASLLTLGCVSRT